MWRKHQPLLNQIAFIGKSNQVNEDQNSHSRLDDLRFYNKSLGQYEINESY